MEATDRKTDKTYDLQLNKGDMLNVERVYINNTRGKTADIVTYDGNTWWGVALDAFETV